MIFREILNDFHEICSGDLKQICELIASCTFMPDFTCKELKQPKTIPWFDCLNRDTLSVIVERQIVVDLHLALIDIVEILVAFDFRLQV